MVFSTIWNIMIYCVYVYKMFFFPSASCRFLCPRRQYGPAPARGQRQLASPPAEHPVAGRGAPGSYRCCWALDSHGHVVICLGATPDRCMAHFKNIFPPKGDISPEAEGREYPKRAVLKMEEQHIILYHSMLLWPLLLGFLMPRVCCKRRT